MSFENRFRDPAFVAVWDRWQKARAEWRKAWWFAPMPTDPYNPVPADIAESWAYQKGRERVSVRSAAQEYLDARVSYKSLVAELIAADPTL